MPVVKINGEEKKVACGPCIRGHRSSKCSHKDRVLIEVRKPGRPLGSCPHPRGMCGCERFVINYTIPRERPQPYDASAFSSSSKVVKNKPQRSVSNMSQLTAQRVISGDPEALAALANIHVDKISVPPPPQPLLASVGPTFTPSSTAPNVETADADTPRSSSDGRDSQEGLGAAWRELHPRPPTSLSETTAATSVQSEPDGQSSCCCAPPRDSDEADVKYDVKTPRNVPLQHLATTASSRPAMTQTLDPVPNANQFNIQDNIAQLNTDFGAYELSAGCEMAQNATMQEPEHSQAACECGDDCECFACMQHPKNRTTLGYVRYHNDLFMREAEVPQLGFGDNNLDYGMALNMQQPQQFATPFASPPVIGDVPWHHSGEPSMSAAPNQFSHEQFQFQPRSQAISPIPTSNPETAYVAPGQPFTPTFAQHPALQHSPAAAIEATQQYQQTVNNGPIVDADAQADDGNSPTLSPSAFMLHEYTLPGCDNFYGTCHCGDGCSCDGCLTHSGHDGYGTATTSAAGETAGTTTTNGTGIVSNGWNGFHADQRGTEH